MNACIEYQNANGYNYWCGAVPTARTGLANHQIGCGSGATSNEYDCVIVSFVTSVIRRQMSIDDRSKWPWLAATDWGSYAMGHHHSRGHPF